MTRNDAQNKIKIHNDIVVFHRVAQGTWRSYTSMKPLLLLWGDRGSTSDIETAVMKTTNPAHEVVADILRAKIAEDSSSAPFRNTVDLYIDIDTREGTFEISTNEIPSSGTTGAILTFGGGDAVFTSKLKLAGAIAFNMA